jgi:hypothetical protein
MKNQKFKLRNSGTQRSLVYRFLTRQVATATMISVATGIPQKNICRYKRELERAGLICQVALDRCEITGRPAWYLCSLSARPNKEFLRS